MYKLLKQLLSTFWKYKKVFFLFLMLTSFLFILRFPWSETLEKIVRQSQKQLSIDLKFKKLKLKVLPPGVAFYKVSLNNSVLKEPITLDTFVFSMAITKWLALKKAWSIEGVKDKSSIAFTFWQEKRLFKDLKTSYVFLEGSSPLLDFSLIRDFLPNIKMEGQSSFKMRYEGSVENLEEAKGVLKLKASQIRWLQSQIETNMGFLELPKLSWSKAEAVLRLKEGNIVVESLVLGSDSDELYLQLRGNGELVYAYNQFRLGSYDFQMKIEVSKKLRLSLIELLLSGVKEESPDKYLYKVRITGQGHKPPHIKRLSEF